MSLAPSSTPTQEHLPTFEHIVAFPQQYRGEPWRAFVERVQLWSRERIERAQASGAYRAIPYYPGLAAAHLGLLVSLAYHSWSEGLCRYAPVRLGERALAALLNDTSRSAKGHAATALRALVAAGAVEVLQDARGRRARLIRVCPLIKQKGEAATLRPSTEPCAVAPAAEKETGQGETAPVPNEVQQQSAQVDQADQAAKAVTERFVGQVTSSTASAWVRRFGPAVILAQLACLSRRDTEGFRRGEVAAFHYCCANDVPAPVTSAARRAEVEVAYQARKQEADAAWMLTLDERALAAGRLI